MRKSRLKQQSTKRAAINAEASVWRQQRVQEIGCCMLCGHSPDHPWRNKPTECSRLAVHEIASGKNRLRAHDKPYATLVLCWFCNGFEVENKALWPEARQLAYLSGCDSQSYDLAAYNTLVNPAAPNRITQEEVDVFFDQDSEKILKNLQAIRRYRKERGLC